MFREKVEDTRRRNNISQLRRLERLTEEADDSHNEHLDGAESPDQNYHYLIVPSEYQFNVKIGVTSYNSKDLGKRYKYCFGREIKVYTYLIKNRKCT